MDAVTRNRDSLTQLSLFALMICLVVAAFGVWLPQLSTLFSSLLVEPCQWVQTWAMVHDHWELLNYYVVLLLDAMALLLLLAVISLLILWYERASSPG
ncbi:MAG: hypothetical protein VYA55_01245 [Pseudomonadota bacterium]|nr:hypothetical protein [Pseudomonadota bacterium]